jgi:hypothetical protein
VVRNFGADREMPPPPHTGGPPVTNIRKHFLPAPARLAEAGFVKRRLVLLGRLGPLPERALCVFHPRIGFGEGFVTLEKICIRSFGGSGAIAWPELPPHEGGR